VSLLSSSLTIIHFFIAELAELEIDRDNVVLVRELGEGQFGKVLEAQVTGLPGAENTSVTAAVKFLNSGSNAADRALFAEEAVRMKPLEHEHVVALLGVCFSSEPAFIVLEYMPKGDLKNFLRNCRPTDEHGHLLGPWLQIEMSRQICSGLSYLHEMNYVHRDIAARNVLIDGNDVLKISDFGMHSE
jgi:serine/threonine protein kinase